MLTTEFLEQNLHLCIPPIRPYQKDELELSESVVVIGGNQFVVEDQNPSQDKLRQIMFAALLRKTYQREGYTLPRVKFILNLYEGVYVDKTQRFAYTAKPNSGHILIPDSHNALTVEKIKEVNQFDIPFSAKNKRAVFAGSDTGARRKDGWTMRSLVSYFYRNSTKVRAGISALDADAEKRFDGRISLLDISGPPLTIQEQLQNQVILNIDGNSTSWERLLWAMASNSLCVYVKPFDGEAMSSWYYPLLEMTGVVPVIEYDRLEQFMDNDFSADYWQQKIQDQKVFANYVSSLDTQTKFLAMVLNKYAEVNK
jgi:hypothetical protein